MSQVTLNIACSGEHPIIGSWEKDFEIEVTFTVQPADPDVGITEPQLEDITLLQVDGRPEPMFIMNNMDQSIVWEAIRAKLEAGEYTDDIWQAYGTYREGPDADDLRDAAIDREMDERNHE